VYELIEMTAVLRGACERYAVKARYQVSICYSPIFSGACGGDIEAGGARHTASQPKRRASDKSNAMYVTTHPRDLRMGS
jgi:hypothetical protein